MSLQRFDFFQWLLALGQRPISSKLGLAQRVPLRDVIEGTTRKLARHKTRFNLDGNLELPYSA